MHMSPCECLRAVGTDCEPHRLSSGYSVQRRVSHAWKSPPWPSLSLVIDVLLHRRAVLQVLRDNPVKQLRRDLSVPYIVRVHHDHGTSRADKKAITPRLSNGLSTFVETVVL